MILGAFMAKVRVYELAKELKIESKKLAEILLAAGLSIKNHMSTLDDAAVLKAKKIVAGEGASVVVEEKRVKPTVIRRRKKRVKSPVQEIIKHIKEEQDVSEEPSKEGAVVQQTEPTVEKKETKVDEAVESTVTVEEETKDTESVQPDTVQPQKTETLPPDIKQITETEALEPEKAETEELSPAHPESEPEDVVKDTGEEVQEDRPEPELYPEQTETKDSKDKKDKKVKSSATSAKIIKKAEGEVAKLLKKQAEEKSRTKATFVKKSKKKPTITVPEIHPYPPIPEEGKPVRKGKKKAGRAEALKRGGKRKVEVYEKKDLYDKISSSRRRSKKGSKEYKDKQRAFKHTEITVPKAIKRKLKVPEMVVVSELAKAMGVKGAELIKKLLDNGMMVNINQSIDFETAALIADDFGYELELISFDVSGSDAMDAEDREEDLKPRPPVVTIMGHVDHGKTSLLDYIRKSNIIGQESGGITQHIGAYYVKTKHGDIVFLDTPGHEAFTAMRARGAELTDIIVLVVAADDGVMPQTREAVNHAKAADIPIIVAVNKIDKSGANPEKIKRELAELDLSPEEWGGDTLYGYVSAKTGEGVDELLHLILLQAEMLDLKANPDRPAVGTVVEARLDKNKGPIATLLIKKGTLSRGQYFVCGEHYGRVRTMLDHQGRKMDFAAPSMPVEISGISGVPSSGDSFAVVDSEKQARQIAEHRKQQAETHAAKRDVISLDDLYARIQEKGIKELRIVLKADVQGSIEAIKDSLSKQNTDEVKIKVIHSGTGGISESDLMLAAASDAIIIGFNVRANRRVTELAERENVDIRYYDVIYNVIHEIRAAMQGLLEPVYKEKLLGHAQVKETFHIPKVGTVAGCIVSDGKVERNANVRLLRDDVVIFDGKLASLRRFKEDVKEVQAGYECGIGLENYNDIKVNDVIEVYQVEEVAAEL